MRRRALRVGLAAGCRAGRRALIGGSALHAITRVTAEDLRAQAMGSASLRVDAGGMEELEALRVLIPAEARIEPLRSGLVDVRVPGRRLGARYLALEDAQAIESGLARALMKITAGRAPSAAGEVALAPLLLRGLGRSIGELVRVQGGVEARITGLVVDSEDLDASVVLGDSFEAYAMFVLGSFGFFEASLVVAAAFAVSSRRRQREPLLAVYAEGELVSAALPQSMADEPGRPSQSWIACGDEQLLRAIGAQAGMDAFRAGRLLALGTNSAVIETVQTHNASGGLASFELEMIPVDQRVRTPILLLSTERAAELGWRTGPAPRGDLVPWLLRLDVPVTPDLLERAQELAAESAGTAVQAELQNRPFRAFRQTVLAIPAGLVPAMGLLPTTSFVVQLRVPWLQVLLSLVALPAIAHAGTWVFAVLRDALARQGISRARPGTA